MLILGAPNAKPRRASSTGPPENVPRGHRTPDEAILSLQSCTPEFDEPLQMLPRERSWGLHIGTGMAWGSGVIFHSQIIGRTMTGL
jgi:hypothetical protein